MPHRLGVCSWSLRPESPADLAGKVRACGLHAAQLALDPIRTGRWTLDDTRRAFDDGGVTLISGMMEMAGEDYSTLETIARTGGVRPDETWAENLAAAGENARIASDLGLSLITFHAGVVPHERSDPERDRIVDRIVRITGSFTERGVAVALETGQESARTMLDLLDEPGLRDVGVNFDPANMILYGTGEPIEALGELTPRIMQAHIKDALPTAVEGTWGSEMPAGEGSVDWDAFCALIAERCPDVDLVIEREAGEAREADVRKARELISSRFEIAGSRP